MKKHRPMAVRRDDMQKCQASRRRGKSLFLTFLHGLAVAAFVVCLVLVILAGPTIVGTYMEALK